MRPMTTALFLCLFSFPIHLSRAASTNAVTKMASPARAPCWAYPGILSSTLQRRRCVVGNAATPRFLGDGLSFTKDGDRKKARKTLLFASGARTVVFGRHGSLCFSSAGGAAVVPPASSAMNHAATHLDAESQAAPHDGVVTAAGAIDATNLGRDENDLTSSLASSVVEQCALSVSFVVLLLKAYVLALQHPTAATLFAPSFAGIVPPALDATSASAAALLAAEPVKTMTRLLADPAQLRQLFASFAAVTTDTAPRIADSVANVYSAATASVTTVHDAGFLAIALCCVLVALRFFAGAANAVTQSPRKEKSKVDAAAIGGGSLTVSAVGKTVAVEMGLPAIEQHANIGYYAAVVGMSLMENNKVVPRGRKEAMFNPSHVTYASNSKFQIESGMRWEETADNRVNKPMFIDQLTTKSTWAPPSRPASPRQQRLLASSPSFSSSTSSSPELPKQGQDTSDAMYQLFIAGTDADRMDYRPDIERNRFEPKHDLFTLAVLEYQRKVRAEQNEQSFASSGVKREEPPRPLLPPPWPASVTVTSERGPPWARKGWVRAADEPSEAKMQEELEVNGLKYNDAAKVKVVREVVELVKEKEKDGAEMQLRNNIVTLNREEYEVRSSREDYKQYLRAAGYTNNVIAMPNKAKNKNEFEAAVTDVQKRFAATKKAFDLEVDLAVDKMVKAKKNSEDEITERVEEEHSVTAEEEVTGEVEDKMESMDVSANVVDKPLTELIENEEDEEEDGDESSAPDGVEAISGVVKVKADATSTAKEEKEEEAEEVEEKEFVLEGIDMEKAKLRELNDQFEADKAAFEQAKAAAMKDAE